MNEKKPPLGCGGFFALKVVDTPIGCYAIIDRAIFHTDLAVPQTELTVVLESSPSKKHMKRLAAIVVALIVLPVVSAAQSLSNETITSRIRAERAEKAITLTFDPVSKTSKVMAVADNFVNSEAKSAGLVAMNFAIGFYYPGAELKTAPANFLFTFWVMAKKPRFADGHDMTVILPEEMLVIGSGRYASKPAEQMEYLNFEVSRESLTKIATQTETRFKLGDQDFTFTRSQMKLLADLLTVTAVD